MISPFDFPDSAFAVHHPKPVEQRVPVAEIRFVAPQVEIVFEQLGYI